MRRRAPSTRRRSTGTLNCRSRPAKYSSSSWRARSSHARTAGPGVSAVRAWRMPPKVTRVRPRSVEARVSRPTGVSWVKADAVVIVPPGCACGWSAGVVEADAQDVALPGVHGTDTVPHLHPVVAACAEPGAVVDGEDHGLALAGTRDHRA